MPQRYPNCARATSVAILAVHNRRPLPCLRAKFLPQQILIRPRLWDLVNFAAYVAHSYLQNQPWMVRRKSLTFPAALEPPPSVYCAPAECASNELRAITELHFGSPIEKHILIRPNRSAASR